MPKGGARPGAGRPKGSPNRRNRQLVQAQAEVAAIAKETGVTPLEHLLQVMRDPATTPTRKDAAAACAAPYLHPRLAMTATLDASAEPCPPLKLTIVAVPRGGQYDAKTGKISYADGTVADPPPFEPFRPTPSLEPMPDEPMPVAQIEPPLGVRLVVDNEDDGPTGAA
jgi:hypothetical protein